jgi:hypothetical protein
MSLSLSRHDGPRRFYDFMFKREHLRLNKEAGNPWPWTDDEILRDYKFTNVKREHDRTTRILAQEFYGPCLHAPLEQKLLNAALARYFGTWEFALAAGWQGQFNSPEREYVVEMARLRLRSEEPVFTGAYVITNAGRKERKEIVVAQTLQNLWEQRAKVVTAIQYNNSWKDAITALRQLDGFGGSGFMAKEVMLDVIIAGGFGSAGPHDRNEWCPAGPGARRGLNRLLGRDKDEAIKEEVAVHFMQELFECRHLRWPRTWVELELHDIQFQLCEYDKYERVRLGEGRPRSRYRPPKK